MKRGYIFIPILLAALFAEAQTERIFVWNKDGRMTVIRRQAAYELDIPPYTFNSYTPSSTLNIDMQLQDFMPEYLPLPEERPMNMHVLSDAYRPFFNIYTPMLRRMSPWALDFREASVVALGDRLSLLTTGEQTTWPLLGGMTAISSNLIWRFDRWTMSAGGFGGRYYTPLTPSPGFMGGVNAQLRYDASSRLAFRLWGQYATYGDSHGAGADPFLMTNPYMNHTGAGGAMEFMFTPTVGAGMSVSYEYNPFKGKLEPQYHFYPVVRPFKKSSVNIKLW